MKGSSEGPERWGGSARLEWPRISSFVANPWWICCEPDQGFSAGRMSAEAELQSGVKTGQRRESRRIKGTCTSAHQKHEHVMFSRSLGRGNRFPKQLINVSVAEEEHGKSTKHHCVNPKLGISQ